MTELLTDAAIEAALSRLPGWQRAGDVITRTVTLPSFPAALIFVCAVGHLAEQADHHPDLLIRYRQVTLTLSTHSAGGLTQRDIDLATAINAIAG